MKKRFTASNSNSPSFALPQSLLLQVHLCYSGPGAVTVSWVTWPREDTDLLDRQQQQQQLNMGSSSVTSSRKLRVAHPLSTVSLSQPSLDLNVDTDLNLADNDYTVDDEITLDHHHHHRHHHHRHHHRKRRDTSDRDPDPSGNCAVLDQLDLQSVVQWGTTTGAYSHQVSGMFDCYSTTAYLSGALHHVVIGEGEGPLPVGEMIFYRVGDPSRNVWSTEYNFTAAPAVGEASLPYSLGLVGDLGQTQHSAETLEHLAAQSVHSVMFMGDLSYADGYQPRWDSWGRLVSAHTSALVWMYTEGNHEIEPSNEAPDFLAYSTRFRVPHHQSGSHSNMYYSYNLAGIHIVMLGSYVDYSESSDQFAWLSRDLATVDRGRTPWVVVGMHAPWYNSNYNHQGDGEEMRVAMERVLYEHGVDVVLAGHVHAYERSYGVFDNEVDPCGPLYINVGDGGNREGLDFDYYKQPTWSAVRDPSYGHAVLDFMNSTHTMFHWHRNQDGVEEVADEVVLVRDPACRRDGAERLLQKKLS